MNGLDFKNYRKKLGISQEQIGKALFVSKRTIVNYEQSEKVPADKVKLMHSIYRTFEDNISNEVYKDEIKEDIEALYAEHIEFKNALNVIKEQGYKAYEIHKQTGLNESGVRRVLNNEIDKPHKKTRKGIIQFANSVSTDVDVTENVDFRDLKIDDKLNVMFNQLQTLKENQNAIASIKEDISLNNEIICKNDRALMLYNLNIQAVFKELKESKVIVKKLR